MQQNLINTIASHSYSKIIFIHCHFLAFAAQKSIPLYEWFVTPRQMTGHLLLQMFKKQSVINEELPKLTQKEGTILHASFGEYKFDINLNFVAKNFALLDLLLEVIGYNLFEKKYNQLATKVDKAGISSVSNEISRNMNEFLKEHFPSASTQKKAKSMHDFLI